MCSEKGQFWGRNEPLQSKEQLFLYPVPFRAGFIVFNRRCFAYSSVQVSRVFVFRYEILCIGCSLSFDGAERSWRGVD